MDKFSGNDPDQDVKSFLLTIENKIDFSLGSPPNDAGEAVRHLFRKKALFSSLLRGPAAEWYEGFNVGNPLPTWIQVRTAFITRFSDDRDKYRHSITAENYVRGKVELVKNFYHRVKQAVDKGWPIDAAANQNERDAQQNSRNQKYIDFTIRGLTPSGLKRKAHEFLIEQPNTTWDNFKDHVANKDLIYSVSSEFVPNSTNEQNSKLDSLEKQVRELSTLLKEQQVNALNQANTRTNDVNNKSRQNATRFVTIVDETSTLYSIAELKLLMTNENVSTIVRTSRKSQPSPMTITRERDRISDHKTTTTPILNTTPILHKDMVIAIVNRIIETKISTMKIITRITLIKDRISELDKITTTFPQGRITTPIPSITEISLRTILTLSLTMCNSLMTTLKK